MFLPVKYTSPLNLVIIATYTGYYVIRVGDDVSKNITVLVVATGT